MSEVIKGMASWQSIPLLVNRRLVFAGIFLIALSGLVLEVSITRIFSAANGTILLLSLYL